MVASRAGNHPLSLLYLLAVLSMAFLWAPASSAQTTSAPDAQPQAAKDAADIGRLTAIINAPTGRDAERKDALYALAMIKSPAVVDAVVAALNHAESSVALRAAQLLANDEGPLALPANVTPAARKALEAAAAHPSADVRYLLADALALLRPVPRDVLLKLSADPESKVRSISIRVLGATGDAKVVPRAAELLSDPESSVSSSAYNALTALGSLATDAVLALVGSGPEATQKVAIEWLGERKEPRAATVLVGVIEDHNQFLGLQSQAAQALKQIRPLDAPLVGRLITVLKDETLDGFAATALDGIQDERIVAPMEAYDKRVAARAEQERNRPWNEEMTRLLCAPCQSDVDCRGKVVTDLRCKPFTSISNVTGFGPVVRLCAMQGFGRSTCFKR